MKKNTTKTAFEKLDEQNFKLVKKEETANIQGGYYYYCPTAYKAYARTGNPCYPYYCDQECVMMQD